MEKDQYYAGRQRQSGNSNLKIVSRVRDPFSYASLSQQAFMNDISDPSKSVSIDDIFSLKVEQAEQRVYLILAELLTRKNLFNKNIESLNNDLVRIKNWRLELPYDQAYSKSRNWMECNKMEIQIFAQIRQERSSFFRDASGTLREFREALLEHRAEHKKSKMFDFSDLEETINQEVKGGGDVVSDAEYR